MSFKFNAKQREVQPILGGLAKWIMLYGGGRSGKTFVVIRSMIARALKAPGSRQLVTRYRFNHLKATIILDTLPKVMRTCFPELVKDQDWKLSKTDWFLTLPADAEMWFCGLDDSERMEKMLGFEFCGIYINEASQVSWGGVQLLLTRLAQKVYQVINGVVGAVLKLRYYFDCNPPSKMHWAYKVFKQKLDPETKENLSNPADYVSFQMNPHDNAENLSPEYLETLEGLSGRMKRRFLHGEFADATPNALFDEAVIDTWRNESGDLPDMVRIVVSVDPSGAGDDEDNTDNDEIGIVVDGLGTDGNAYLLEDLTVKGGPATWGAIAVSAYQRHSADVVVGESNFGGGMVKYVIQTTAAKEGARVNFKMVTASRGKVQRAEPFSALYEQGKIRHVGVHAPLEDELCAFSTTGYTGPGSPNRADAHIWALAELFPGLIKGAKKKEQKSEEDESLAEAFDWMG